MSTPKVRILYVEDYPVIQKIYLDVLQNHGFDVDTASDGKEALEKAKTETYDVILLDLLLPHVSGLQFLEEYRKLDTPGKVIVLTDFDNPETVERVKKLGFDDYWMKVENTPHSLAERIDRLLKQT